MKRRQILSWISQWESDAKLYAGRNMFLWDHACTQIWTAEFILGIAGNPGYIHPNVRIPFEKPALQTVGAA